MSPDDRLFVRDNRPLRQWLPELLGPDPATRRRAENAVSAIWWGAPVADTTVYEHLPSDAEAHRAAFGWAVGQILNDPAFPGERFVIDALETIRQDRRRSVRLYELEDELLESAAPAGSPEYAALMERIEQGHVEENLGKLPNSFDTHTLVMVLEQAGPVLLRMPEVVRAALRRRQSAGSVIAKALEHLGPAAAAFAPDLLEAVVPASEYERRRIAYPEALASVARNDQATVRRLLEIVRSDPDDSMAGSAVEVLGRMGPAAARVVPTLVDDLLAVADDSDRGRWMLATLASLAPDRRHLFDRLVAAARPGPPDMRAVEGHSGYRYDATMSRRGPALEALGHFNAFADEAVGVLIEALETFKEYDPDWGYDNGEHGRIVSSLDRLGPASSAAVPALVRHLRGSQGEVDWCIIELFAALGPRAAEALPVLRLLQVELAAEVETESTAPDPPDETLNPLEWAIGRIEGRL